MATLTVYPGAGGNDGIVSSTNATYLTARAGSGLVVSDTSGVPNVGQLNILGNYSCYEMFVQFDTSALGASAIVSAASLKLVLILDSSTNDFTNEARISNWGASLTTADWVAGASLSALTSVATLSTSGIGATDSYKTFAENGTNFQTNISLTGTTYLLIDSSRHVAGNVPGANVSEFVGWEATERNAGTSTDPKIDITYTLPANITKMMLMGIQ